ncbi:hypothetical protein ACH5RR_024970 [Cinchona calisaya]|uniref:Uncharacterized protein n=1 Tax=Cinchona calisaya TaxID=153742 RepID=A0ABD2Z3B1_9GENT
MMTEEGKVANALGGKTARACESCLKKRARWFCAADDAFLCQACDSSVHSANQLASRHERVRLETSSCKAKAVETKQDENSSNSQPTWHQGFTRKARTPRNPKAKAKANSNSFPLVPETISDETYNSPDESDQEQLIFCRVPVFDPQNIQVDESFSANHELDLLLKDDHQDLDIDHPEMIVSDAELAEFAADVESLLGAGLEEEDSLLDVSNIEDKRVVKVEDEDDHQEVQAVIACHFDPALDTARESLNWYFDYLSQMTREEDQVKVTIDQTPLLMDSESKKEEKGMILLKLNYEDIITAWASQGSPWADGTKPEFNPDGCWPDLKGTSHSELHNLYGAGGCRIGNRDEEREARVSRYREKRRTRLFSKKIRYEVRKLNAEKRPRMKGRFVKRTTSYSFAGHSNFPNCLVNKSS